MPAEDSCKLILCQFYFYVRLCWHSALYSKGSLKTQLKDIKMGSQQFKTQYDFLFVGRDEGSFVENYAYDLGEGGESSGKIYICLEILQNSLDTEKIGEIMFDRMRKVFFSDADVDGYERFEEAIKEVNRSLNEYRVERGNDWLGKLNVIIMAIVGNQLYLTQSGDAEAYLVRKKLTSTISDDLSEADSRDVFTNIASGDLEHGDLVLVSTTRLLRYVSKTDLSRHVGGSLQSTVQGIKDFLHGEVVERVGLIVIQGSVVQAGAPVEQVAHVREESFSGAAGAGGRGLAGAPAWLSGLASKGRQMAVKYWQKGSAYTRDLLREGGEKREKVSNNPWDFTNWGKDKIMIAIVALVLVLTVGVWWLRAKSDESSKIQMLADDLVQVREQINSAVTTGQFDKARAGDMLNAAEQKAITVLNSGYHKSKARDLLDMILETRDRLDGVMHPKMEKMVDLSTKRENVSALGLVKLKDKLYAYEYNALYPIMLDQVGDPLTVDDNEKVVAAVNYEDKDSILFLTESGKIKEFKDDNMSFLTTTDGSFKKGVNMQAYSNKIFILDPSGNQIWRYTRRRDTFDAAQAYATGADLKNAIDLAIDGNIYVLGQDGFITKLFQGNKEDFPIKKQPVKTVTTAKAIYSEADMSQIYVLDAGESRVLVYLKDDRTGGAVYTGQYIFDDLKDIRDFFVDKNTNTMYVLTEKELYRTNL